MNSANRNENDVMIDASMENDYLFTLNISENTETIDDGQCKDVYTKAGCGFLYI